MGDNSHSLSEQGSVRNSVKDNNEDLNFKEVVERLRENETKRERELEETRGMFT